MNLDFWNNPLVVSALRVRYRQGGILRLSTIWLVLLVIAGMAVYAVRNEMDRPWNADIPWYRVYFFILYGVQWFVSCAAGGLGAFAGMNAEVTNRTLDFQRIAALSPRQILLGKLLGEPIQAYLLALTSVPLAVWCWGVGVPGLTFPVLLLLYLNLFTSILLFSSAGLVVRTELKDGKPQGGAGGLVLLGIWCAMTFFAGMTGASAVLRWPGFTAVSAVVAPVPAFLGLVEGDAFLFPVTLFGCRLPALLVTPLCQLGGTVVFFRVMERRLTHPLATTLSKPMAYLLLAATDLLTAGVLCDAGPTGLPTVPRVAVFCAVHLGVALVLITLATPGWETLSSWVWRYRRRRPWWRDLFLGERSPNDLVGPAFSVLGGVILGLLVLGPALMQNGSANLDETVRVALTAWALLTLLTLLGASLMQWLALAGGKVEGGALVILLLILIDGVVHATGAHYNLHAVRQMSASALAAGWLGMTTSLDPRPLLLTYAIIVLLLWLGWRRLLARLETAVDARLRQMGISKDPHQPEA